MKKTTVLLLLCLLQSIAAADQPLGGIPFQTTFPALLLDLGKRYNSKTCNKFVGSISNSTTNHLVTVLSNYECDGQKITVNGTGNKLEVKFPLETYNYTAINIESLTACGQVGGCFKVLYVGNTGELQSAMSCSADVTRSSGAPTTNCTSCKVDQGVFMVQLSIECDNADSSYTTTGAIPFSYNSSVMGVTLPPGTGSSDAGKPWHSGVGMVALGLVSVLYWM